MLPFSLKSHKQIFYELKHRIHMGLSKFSIQEIKNHPRFA